MNRLSTLISIGTRDLPDSLARRVRVVNLTSCIALVVSIFYIGFYVYIGAIFPVFINIMASLAYGMTLFWSFQNKFTLARIWVFSIYLIHLCLLALLVFTKNTGFHFYYLVTPYLVFLVFDHKQTPAKLALSGMALALFLVCELASPDFSYIQFSPRMEYFLYLTSIFISTTGTLIIVIMFTVYMKAYEDKQAQLIHKLEQALSEVKTLKGFLPICSSCKKIRDDKGYWNQIESYIQAHSSAEFSHGICPDCADKLYGRQDWYKKRKTKP